MRAEDAFPYFSGGECGNAVSSYKHLQPLDVIRMIMSYQNPHYGLHGDIHNVQEFADGCS